MPVTTSIADDGATYTIAVHGRFDLSMYRSFREAFEKVDLRDKRVQLDLAAVEGLDGTALGMLLLLREHAGGDRARIDILNCSSALRQSLTTANFHHLFNILPGPAPVTSG